MDKFTPDVIVAVAAALITIVSFYVPKFQSLEKNKKQVTQLIIMALVALGAFGLSCTSLYNFVSCDMVGASKVVEYFTVAVLSQVATYGSTKYIFGKDEK